jgi:hypothetical protein
MRDYWSNPSDPKRYESYDFKPTGSKGAAYVLVGLLLALVVGSLFLGTPTSERGNGARSPDQTIPAPQR